MKRNFYNLFLALFAMSMCLSVRAESSGEADGWPLCPNSLEIPARPHVSEPLAPEDIHISADKVDIEEEGISVLQGNVEITRGTQQVSADTVTYDQTGETADLEGDVEYWDDDIYVQGDKGHVEFFDNTGQFEGAKYKIKENRARGDAAQITLNADKTVDLVNVDYSTCDPADNFWKLSASKISLDNENNKGTARNVVLRIKGFPVFYTPYASFPLRKERKTGFLFPEFGSSRRNGADIRTPFYWNIAPNMDATLTPRLMTDSGVMLMGKFRYMFSRGSGEFNGEFLPDDNDFNDENRNLIGITHEQSFADRGRFYGTYNQVSDKQYFEDFGSNLSLTSTRYLERRADASYSGKLWGGGSWNILGRAQSYQTVDRTIPVASRPYKRLPQFKFSANSPRKNNQLNYQLRSEVVNFDRGDNNISTSSDVNGLRTDLMPTISYPMYTASSFITPQLSVRYTQYSLSDEGTFKSSPSRILPIASMDSGLFMERNTTLMGRSFLQTLEPRLFYLYVPENDQDDLPVFDTGIYDFSFNQLFRTDRFSGPDRVGDANQFTLALTSRFIDNSSGREKGYVSLGQIYYLNDRDVILPSGRKRDESSSPLVTEIGTSIIDHWRFRGNLQWDPNNNQTEKMTAFLQYNPEPSKVVNLGYRSRNTINGSTSTSNITDIEQTDLSFHWPFNQSWSIVGRWNYAIPETKSLEIFGGLEYESCCWGFRVIARRFLTDIDGDYENGIFMQLELKGLAGVGQKTVEYLEQRIPGYQRDF